MILDETDPTGLGLFSRCGRNQACKTTKSRPHTAGSNKSLRSEIKIQEQKKKSSCSINWFDKQQSRQQRQKKFKISSTPAVGQYNPTQKSKPKLIWDMLKIFQKKNKSIKRIQEPSSPSKLAKKHSQEKNTSLNHTLQQIQTTEKYHTIDNHAIIQNGGQKNQNLEKSQKSAIAINQLLKSHKDKRYSPTKEKNPTIRYQQDQQFNMANSNGLKSQSLQRFPSRQRQKTYISNRSGCLVNMSRTTGRKSAPIGLNGTLNYSTQSKFLLDQSSITKSISKIKSKTTKNIYFKKMMGRKQFDNKHTTSNIYDCNVDMIKPRISAQVNFGILKGREDSLSRSKQQSSVFSYTHYDYNEYVWKNKSSVYPNTKRNLISFQKQR